MGFGLIIVGFEFEWSHTSGEDLGDGDRARSATARRLCARRSTTGMGNVLLQTPRGLGPVQVYGTVGAGAYRERYRRVDEND